MAQINPFDFLGVPRYATAEIVRRAAKEMLLRFHPDKNMEHGPETLAHCTEMTQAINQAWGMCNEIIRNRERGHFEPFWSPPAEPHEEAAPAAEPHKKAAPQAEFDQEEESERDTESNSDAETNQNPDQEFPKTRFWRPEVWPYLVFHFIAFFAVPVFWIPEAGANQAADHEPPKSRFWRPEEWRSMVFLIIAFIAVPVLWRPEADHGVPKSKISQFARSFIFRLSSYWRPKEWPYPVLYFIAFIVAPVLLAGTAVTFFWIVGCLLDFPQCTLPGSQTNARKEQETWDSRWVSSTGSPEEVLQQLEKLDWNYEKMTIELHEKNTALNKVRLTTKKYDLDESANKWVLSKKIIKIGDLVVYNSEINNEQYEPSSLIFKEERKETVTLSRCKDDDVWTKSRVKIERGGKISKFEDNYLYFNKFQFAVVLK